MDGLREKSKSGGAGRMKGCWAKWGGVFFLVLFPFWFGGAAFAAESTEAELRGLKERLHAVEAEVAQREVALTALDAEDREGVSALSAFFETVDISGLVAAGGSWQKSREAATGLSNKDSTFQLYQGWLEINKTPTEESRAGFNIALEMGDTATQAGQLQRAWDLQRLRELSRAPGQRASRRCGHYAHGPRRRA